MTTAVRTAAMPPGQSVDYRPIADYALIGNTHSAALVASDGSIDWCCLPHFDSGAVLCRLLDAKRGGYFRVGPAGRHSAARRYLGDSAVLQTDFTTARGKGRVTDFMASPDLVASRLGLDDAVDHRLLRRIEGLDGEIEFELALKATFDFARVPARLEPTSDGVIARAPAEELRLRLLPATPLAIEGDTAVARVRLRAGERAWAVLGHADARSARAERPADPERLLEETCRRWRAWSALCTYEGPYADEVRASARVLKLLTYGPTGALVAAPTCSLPEAIGGVRNWDYRYCWLRDAALVLHALMSIGYHVAADDFFVWLQSLHEDDGRTQIMYRLDGGRELPEQELPHLEGYRGSAPVRIGNAAASQTQLDVYGHVLDAALNALQSMKPTLREGPARVLARLADEAAARWREPGSGLWEARSEPRHYVSSKLMCWVALDRAVRLAGDGLIAGAAGRWRRERDALRHELLEHGYDREAGAFTQVLGSPELDASVLLMPLVGFLPPDDPRMRSTVERVRERLVANGLVHRYLGDDGVAGGEATFAMCSCWLVDNLALQGRLDEARALLERVLGCANDVGLLAEEIDPVNGELLGNYPQGFTHLAVIMSALTIARVERGEQGAR